ncbi:MAG: hypothetical protein ACYS8Z_05360 [Planctomycetota bacterium]|jgi:opacity protein-like surface antigen
MKMRREKSALVVGGRFGLASIAIAMLLSCAAFADTNADALKETEIIGTSRNLLFANAANPTSIQTLLGTSPISATAGDKDVSDLQNSNNWDVSVNPYFWAPSLKGRSTISGHTASIDLSFDDIISDFDVFALSTRVIADKDRWRLIFDGLYFSMETDLKLQTPPPIGSTINVNVDIAQANTDFALGYKLWEVPIGKRPNQKMTVIPYGGFRYAYLKQKINFKPGPTLGTSKDWVEPLVGVQLSFGFNDKLSGMVYSDFAGFDIGSASKLTWNLLAGIGYTCNEKHYFKIGYRVYDIDYSNGSGSDKFGLDAKFQGPWIGATFRF